MIARRLAIVAALTACLSAPARAAADAPAWSMTSLATPTEFVAGDTAREYTYEVRATNIGAAETSGTPVTVIDTLPRGLTLAGQPSLIVRSQPPGGVAAQAKDIGPTNCGSATVAEVTTVTCTVPSSLAGAENNPARIVNGDELRLTLPVHTPASAVAGEHLQNHVEVEGGGAPAAAANGENQVATLDSEGNPLGAPAGFSYYDTRATDPNGLPVIAAGSHPFQFTVEYAVNTDPGTKAVPIIPAGGDLKDTALHLPPGLVGSATAVEQCTRKDFNAIESQQVGGLVANATPCPDGSAVGFVTLKNIEGTSYNAATPLYNLVPPPGEPAQFGFRVANAPFFIDNEVRSGSDYGLTSVLRNQSQAKRVSAASVTIWGNPADPRHDSARGNCLVAPVDFRVPNGECEAGITPRYLLRLPTSCQGPLDLLFEVNRWPTPSLFGLGHSTPLSPVGCGGLGFEPSLQARPSTDVADQPSGLDAHLHIPQEEDPNQLGTADLRKTVVSLPEGLVINPSGARGLDACTPAQIGLLSGVGASPPQFTPGPSACPSAARIGTAEVDTPLLGHRLQGGVYVASPHRNPFGSLLAIYIAVNDDESGIYLKLAGEVKADPQTGRLTTTFDETPQQPFSDFELHFYGGPYAALRTPAICGEYSTDSVMTPWSAPESGPPATDADHYSISRAPGGGACPTSPSALPNANTFEAGTEAAIAGAYSPIAVKLSRPDGSQEFDSLTLTPPPGLLASLAGIPYCSEAAIAAAASKSGREEEAHPSCPAASQIGTATVGAGAGPSPYYVTGKLYLAGAYEGAPLSLVAITPAAAGPYDLGTVAVRSALHVDPATARITATTDPIPHILAGVPLDVRSIAVRLDHTGWGLNPTSCDPSSFDGSLRSLLGQTAALSSRFQVGECGRLSFRPRLALSLEGKSTRGGFPALRAVYTAKPGEANLEGLVLRFPHSEFIEQGHFRTICTRAQWAAGEGNGTACPAGSVYGHVRATTPLLDSPLEGPVYLRSSDHKLPDVVLALRGQIDAEVAIRVDSAKGGLRTTIEQAPDVPVSRVVLTMQGGKKGLFVNSRDICARTYHASLSLAAHNGKLLQASPPMRAKCGGKEAKRRRGHDRRGGRG